MFSAATQGLAMTYAYGYAKHLSDTVQGSNWVGTYGNAGYILPSTPTSQTILNSNLKSTPSWVEAITVFSLLSYADTTCDNQPNKPDNSGLNLYLTSASTSSQIQLNIGITTGIKKVAFYMTNDTTAPDDSLKVTITPRNAFGTTLVTGRTYKNTANGTGISTTGGLVAQYEMSGYVQFLLTGSGSLSTGLIHAIFFDD